MISIDLDNRDYSEKAPVYEDDYSKKELIQLKISMFPIENEENKYIVEHKLVFEIIRQDQSILKVSNTVDYSFSRLRHILNWYTKKEKYYPGEKNDDEYENNFISPNEIATAYKEKQEYSKIFDFDEIRVKINTEKNEKNSLYAKEFSFIGVDEIGKRYGQGFFVKHQLNEENCLFKLF